MDLEGIDPKEMFDDETPIEELMYLISVEFHEPEAELLNWIDVIQNSDIVDLVVSKVKDLKVLVQKRAIWRYLILPAKVQAKVEEYLFPDNPFQNEEEILSPRFKNRERRDTIISPEVLNLISSPEEVKIDLEDAGIDPDLADELSQLGINIGEKKENTNAYELVLSNFGLSSFLEEEIEWMIRVLENSQRKHALAVVRLYTCKVGESEWVYSNIIGGAGLVTEANLQNQCSHFIRVIDLNGFNPNKSTIFQQEFYFGMKYTKDTEFFHSFEGANILIGLSFASIDEANYFYEKVQYCLTHKPSDVIEQLYDEKEKSYMLVGDNSVRVATAVDGISIKTRQKYATGGITDGIEVKWSKPKPPPNLLEILGPVENEEDEEKEKEKEKVRPRRNTVYQETQVIDLIKDAELIPRMERSSTLSLGASPTLFSEGNAAVADGISLSWTKNATSLTADADKTADDIKKDLELRIKRLKDRKKNALEVGDKETAIRLRDQINDLTLELRKYYNTSAKPQKNSFFRKMRKSSAV